MMGSADMRIAASLLPLFALGLPSQSDADLATKLLRLSAIP